MKRLFLPRSPAIQLSSDDEDELGNSGLSFGFGGCVSCLPRLTPLTSGTIQLQAEDATLNDYLDPNTTTTIEPLLDEYNNQSGFNGTALHNSNQFLTRNPFASTTTTTAITKTDVPRATNNHDNNQSYQEQQDSFARVDFFMENENDGDAEFLSDHRISAVIGDTKKLVAQLELFDSQAGHVEQDSNSLDLDKEEDDDNGNIGHLRPFEIQSDWTEAQDMESGDDQQQDEEQFDLDENNTGSQPLDDMSLDTTTITCELDSINEEQPVQDTTDEQISALNNVPLDNKVESPLLEPILSNNPSDTNEIKKDAFTPLLASSPPSPLPTVSNDDNRSFPSVGLPRTAYTPSSGTLDNSVDGVKSQMLPPTNTSTPGDNLIGKRRSSVAAVAHSLLGDKLDDFTEKLAYIRKNIIMSLDDDDDDDNDDNYNEDNKYTQQQPLRRSRSGSMQPEVRRQSFDPFASRLSGQQSSSSKEPSGDPRTTHRRSNSMMDMAPSFAKIVLDKGKSENGHFSPSSFFASLAGPDIPSSSSPPPRRHRRPPLDEDDEEEDLFDFSKVIAMGKNVRNYSEDLMGNGLRLFNDFSTRMKNANTARPDQLLSISQFQQQQHLDGQQLYNKQARPQQEQQQQQSSVDQEFLLGDTFF
ncbi:hypothetical protein BC941DRAFT_518130 [Chlamydoabsidia padenii]|nr:hypothetical protein BC941DRAFT_518130 [Chlamydoabsidia padenii]